jgi:hypothetical protein
VSEDLDTLRADLNYFSLAVNTKPFNVFFYKSPHMLEYMLEPGYFNSIYETSIRVHDRIEVVANAGGEAEYATIAVKKISNTGTHKEIEVSLLFCNK